jgi:Flp pilus assembly protein protease CpaA
MLSELSIILVLLWIGLYDIRNHLVRNLELFTFLLLVIPKYWENIDLAIVSLLIYVAINLVSLGKLGMGDIKLSLVLGFLLDSLFEISISIGVAWVLGGIYAITRRAKSVPFAPFMILGTYFARIL